MPIQVNSEALRLVLDAADFYNFADYADGELETAIWMLRNDLEKHDASKD